MEWKFEYIGGTGERRMFPLKTDDICLVLAGEVITVRHYEDYDILKRSDKYRETVEEKPTPAKSEPAVKVPVVTPPAPKVEEESK